MPNPVDLAAAYLEKLEADRQAAIDVSEQKAVEAKLIAARQEGFRAAMDILAGAIRVHPCRPQVEKPSALADATDSLKPQTEKTTLRRQRRDIRELIIRELTFTGRAMTARQIATAINYVVERTETALRRLEHEGKVLRNENDRWVAALVTSDSEPNAVAVEPHYLPSSGIRQAISPRI